MTAHDSTGMAGPGNDEPVTVVPGKTTTIAAARPAGRASAGSIRGIVKGTDGKPLPYVNVMVLGTAWGAMSNQDGVFSIRNVPEGVFAVKAVCIGYSDRLVDSVAVLPELTASLDIELEQKVVGTMDMVEITAARQLIKMKSTESRHDIDSKSMENLPIDEVSERIGLKAGVVAQGGELHFRGGRSGEVRYQVDGAPVGDPRLGGSASQPAGNAATPPSPPVVPTTGGSTLPNDEVYDSMYFEHYGVNPFIVTEEDSLSTFAADVDAASYTLARRYIELGHLPPKDAVRVEEFINFFQQGYPEFHEPDFRILIDGAPSAFGDGYHLLRIGLKGRVVDPEHRKPANLTFVIDVSGSMQREDRLELVKQALEILIDKLRPDDRVGLIVYGTHARLVLEPTSIGEKGTLLREIRALHPEGSTNAEEGLLLGYEMARRNHDPRKLNRIILCADGVANEGVTSAEAILDRVRREADRGIALSTIGFGMGNYNDVLMEKLADRGDGNYYYVDRLDEAARVFEENLTATLQTIARDVKIQVAFDLRRVARYRLLGFENRDVADRDFRNDRVDAGEIGAGHEMTALYEVKLIDGVKTGRIATVRVRYARPDGDSVGPPDVRELEGRFDAGDLARSFDEAQPRFRLDAAAAELAEILRHSFWAKESRLVDVLSIARRVAGELGEDADVQAFAKIVERATGLGERVDPGERDSGARPTQPSPSE
jgi:Ca-activated chloride channel family protein